MRLFYIMANYKDKMINLIKCKASENRVFYFFCTIVQNIAKFKRAMEMCELFTLLPKSKAIPNNSFVSFVKSHKNFISGADIIYIIIDKTLK